MTDQAAQEPFLREQRLQEEIKALIVEALMLDDVTPSEIETDGPLFGEGLGLDSIDALELGIALNHRYGVKIDVEDEGTREWFASVGALARFVSEEKEQQAEEQQQEEQPRHDTQPASERSSLETSS